MSFSTNIYIVEKLNFVAANNMYMDPLPHYTRKSGIIYSCYDTLSRKGEHFVPEHVFSCQIAGTTTVHDGVNEYVFKEGDFRFFRRNQLAKFTKQPPEGGEFRSVSILLDQELLRDISMEYGFRSAKKADAAFVTQLSPSPLYKSFIESLLPYSTPAQAVGKSLQQLKIRELVLILLQANPELKDLLFDFSEPGKIDLEAFMQRNFHFNVEIKRFAYLTGRSLATFKRDFGKVFNTSPSRWLLQRRLKEAYYQIMEMGKRPGDVYLDVGFEDLSHFSFAFKNLYGVPPSRLRSAQ